MAETIGDRLRRIRRDAALAQEQLAAISGVSRDLIAMLEQNRRQSARVSTLAKLANALDVEMSELLDKRPRLESGMDASVLAIRDTLLSPAHLPGFDASDWGSRHRYRSCARTSRRAGVITGADGLVSWPRCCPA